MLDPKFSVFFLFLLFLIFFLLSSLLFAASCSLAKGRPKLFTKGGLWQRGSKFHFFTYRLVMFVTHIKYAISCMYKENHDTGIKEGQTGREIDR